MITAYRYLNTLECEGLIMIVTLVKEIIDKEWEMFQEVNNCDGRSSCQDNRKAFVVMRRSQYSTWPPDVLKSYLDDLNRSKKEGRNLVSEKYARMMASTHPDEYLKFEDGLPSISSETASQIEKIVAAHLCWKQILGEKYPHLNDQGRPLTSDLDTMYSTSFETYLRGELQTYSSNTIAVYNKYIEECFENNCNLAEENLQIMVESYGFKTLEEANASSRPSL